MALFSTGNIRGRLQSCGLFRLRSRGGKLTLDAPIPDTVAGRDALAEIRSGLFKGLSIEFRAVRQTIVGGRPANLRGRPERRCFGRFGRV